MKNKTKYTYKPRLDWDKSGNFANCKKCDRPYKKGLEFPEEICPACVVENK